METPSFCFQIASHETGSQSVHVWSRRGRHQIWNFALWFSANPCVVCCICNPAPVLQLLSNTHTQVVERREEGKEEVLVSEWVGDTAVQRWKRWTDRSIYIYRWIDRFAYRLVSGCELCVKPRGEEKEEKHESAAVPGSGFNGLPQ